MRVTNGFTIIAHYQPNMDGNIVLLGVRQNYTKDSYEYVVARTTDITADHWSSALTYTPYFGEATRAYQSA